MNQQPDKLFRDKLEGFHKPAPSAAWNKIEAGLQKKNNKAIWLRVAAAVLIVAVAAFLIWANNSTTTSPQIAKDSDNQKETPVQKENKVEINTDKKETIEEPEQGTSIASTTPEKIKRRRKNQPVGTKSVEAPVVVEEPAIEELISFTPSVGNSVDSSDIVTPIVEDVIVAQNTIEQSQESDQSRVLVFSVEEVDAKYLDKEALAKATSAQKKSSTFRKLLNKAYDLKNNQDPFGELRQKKNEILALNFKSEKRSQNK